jgi:GNAT superfamily N-acetyltransferase
MARANLSIEPLKPEEAHLYQVIRHESFRSTINKVHYTREPSEATQQKVIENHKKGIADGVLFMACKDNDTGEMIAGARWRYVGPKDSESFANGAGDVEAGKRPRYRTWEEVEEGLTIPEPYEETDPRVYEAVFGQFNQSKREILGTRPYYALDTLVTHPNHHRRGAGAMLTQWGCEEADKKDVEAYLEASPMGEPLYARYGFQRVKVVSVDLREFGGDDTLDFIVSSTLVSRVIVCVS